MNERPIPEITRSEPAKYQYFPMVTNDLSKVEKIDKPEDPPELRAEITLSIWEKVSLVWVIVKQIIVSLIYIKGIKMENEKKDYKTTIAATVKVILGLIAVILTFFGVELPAGIQESVIALCVSGYLVFSWIQGLFTKDKEK